MIISYMLFGVPGTPGFDIVVVDDEDDGREDDNAASFWAISLGIDNGITGKVVPGV